MRLSISADSDPLLHLPLHPFSEQLQRYTLALVGTVKDMRSLIHVELNSEGKITRLEDRWDNKPLPQGSIAKTFRGLNGQYITPAIVTVPKSDAEKK
jgi:hypothetical protein